MYYCWFLRYDFHRNMYKVYIIVIINIILRRFLKPCWVLRTPSYGPPFYSFMDVPKGNLQQTHVIRHGVPHCLLRPADRSRPLHHQLCRCFYNRHYPFVPRYHSTSVCILSSHPQLPLHVVVFTVLCWTLFLSRKHLTSF